jgi:hypothetical protein
MKKSQNMLVWLSIMVWPSMFAQDAEAGKRHRKALAR